MKLHVIDSGSDGNGYLLYAGDEVLILECGCPLIEAKKALNFDLSHVVGCYISHGHTDHAKYRRDYEKLGVTVFAPYDADAIKANKRCGNFDIQSFRLEHGDTFSHGALIRHLTTGETILFMTDFLCTPYIFQACRVNHYLIECNYQPQYVEIGAGNKEHKLMGHCSLDTAGRFVKANYNTHMQNIILCHLGITSTNPKECVKHIEDIAGPNVFVDYARANTDYELIDRRLPFSE